ncbi:hypothetical protein NE237_011517 [Protea cynaroides]|uniref:Protein kinase domain-containing protein n=1 Tax=Protea cynaroides TaxID=273540 RepID=A0A9Q0GW77_9MAGN|nr:hypothetical protein NE237_011517 [Protea cynaroides]
MGNRLDAHWRVDNAHSSQTASASGALKVTTKTTSTSAGYSLSVPSYSEKSIVFLQREDLVMFSKDGLISTPMLPQSLDLEWLLLSRSLSQKDSKATRISWYLTEVNYLGQLHHPNLVKLFGGGQPLSWAIRIKVAIGAARGLSFLRDAESQVIYRDFKASNILLDSEFNAKLCDFGLAKAGPTGDKTHVSTQVMGTRGYAAPEYVATEVTGSSVMWCSSPWSLPRNSFFIIRLHSPEHFVVLLMCLVFLLENGINMHAAYKHLFIPLHRQHID